MNVIYKITKLQSRGYDSYLEILIQKINLIAFMFILYKGEKNNLSFDIYHV